MKYWIGVACKEHVERGMAGGFCQLCHGKSQPLRRMSAGDWIIYYLPQLTMMGKDPCQQFTAIGRVQSDEVYAFAKAPGGTSFRRDIEFLPAQAIAIRPLLSRLGFIKDKQFSLSI
ncbi:MAG TPA: EVE domain-containing protein [Cellvibrio sp.]|nr:EVE domain-containing protein [Cellvibrio sp.]